MKGLLSAERPVIDTVSMKQAGRTFEHWYRECHPRVSVTLLAVLGDADVTQNAVDEAFVRAYQRWTRVNEMASPDGWVYRVALNEARRVHRRRKMEQTLLRRKALEQPVQQMDGPAGEIWCLVAELPLRQRQAVALRYIGGLTEAQVASAMGVARSTVSTTLRSAHRSLENSLDEDEELEP